MADTHYSFMGATDPLQMEPHARELAGRLKEDKVETIATRRCDNAGPVAQGRVLNSGHSTSAISEGWLLTDRIDGDVRGAFALRQAAPHRLDCGCVLADPDYATGGTISVCSICGSIFSIACGEICRASKPGASGSAMLSCSINST